MTSGQELSNKIIEVVCVPAENSGTEWWIGLNTHNGFWDTSCGSQKIAETCANRARDELATIIDKLLPMNTYQDLAKQTAVYPDIGRNLIYTILGLVGESGELAEKMKKAIRDNGGNVDTETMVKELGDVLWYVAMIASELGLTLQEVAQKNVDKLRDRRKRNVLHGSGDNR
jgi:NTP pyrophosphatase (non-canonical NTP hydrolase)